MANQLDRLTGQLYHLPAIIGRLGISIAEAQKELDVNYVNAVGRLLTMIKDTMGNVPDGQTASAAAVELLKALAPSRYQFTETTIEFRADLSESMQLAAQAGLGLGTKALMVNAALALGYGYQYEAAARISCVLHARPVGPELASELLSRAKEINKDKLALPAPSDLDKDLSKAVTDVFNAIPSWRTTP